MCVFQPQSTYRGRVEMWGVYLPSQLERTPCTTLYVIVDRVKGGGRITPHPSPGWADFSIMMECTPKSGNCHSVCTLWYQLGEGGCGRRGVYGVCMTMVLCCAHLEFFWLFGRGQQSFNPFFRGELHNLHVV